jgi:hypothetical protein
MDIANRTGIIGIVIGAGLAVAALMVPWEIPMATRHIMFWFGSFGALAGSLDLIRVHFLKSKTELIKNGFPGLSAA